MARLRETMVDPVRCADHVEPHWPGDEDAAVSRRPGDRDAGGGLDRVETVGRGAEETLGELPGGAPVRRLGQRQNGDPARSVNGVEERERAFGWPQSAETLIRRP